MTAVESGGGLENGLATEAAGVIAERAAVTTITDALYALEPDVRPGTAVAFARASDRARTAARALAAAGLLVEPERDKRVTGRALREWGQSLADRYPEDLFIEPRRDAWSQIAGALAAIGHTLDAVSASCMRRAARIAVEDADRIERQEATR